MRRLALALVVALTTLAAPVAAQDIGATTVLSEQVTAAAAAWTDVTLSSMDCVSGRCISSGEASFVYVYSSGAACRILLRAESGEATTAAIYVPSGGAISLPVYGTGTSSISLHGDGNTPTVYLVVGRR